MTALIASGATLGPVMVPGPWQNATFAALAVVMALALRWMLRMPPRLWAAVLTWQAGMGALAWNGYFQQFDQPWRALPTVALGIGAAGWWASRPFGGSGRWFLQAPAWAWVAVQSFRLPLELWLYGLFSTGVIDRRMTFAGANADIAVGLSAPLLAFFMQRQNRWQPGLRRWLLAWNVLGLGLLLNVVMIAVLSMPLPFQVFTTEPANRFIAQFPFIGLPTLMVPLALMAHIVSLRRALAQPRQTPLDASA